MDGHEEFKARLDAYLAENFFEEEFFAEESFAEKIFEKKFFAPIKVAARKISRKKVYYSHSASDLLLTKANFEKFFEENEEETFSEKMMRLVEESGEKKFCCLQARTNRPPTFFPNQAEQKLSAEQRHGGCPRLGTQAGRRQGKRFSGDGGLHAQQIQARLNHHLLH